MVMVVVPALDIQASTGPELGMDLHLVGSTRLLRFGASVLSAIGLGAVLVSRYRRSAQASSEVTIHLPSVDPNHAEEAAQVKVDTQTRESSAGPAVLVEFLKEAAVPLVALFAAAGYAMLRPAFDGFYYALGLRPEDVGLNEVQMLSLGSVFRLFYGVALILAALFLYWFLPYMSSKHPEPLRQYYIGLALTLAGWAVVKFHITAFLINIAPRVSWLRDFRLAVIVALLIAGLSLILSAAIGRPVVKWRRSDTSDKNRKRSPIYIALTFAFVALLVMAGLGRIVGESVGQDLLNNPGTFTRDHPLLSNLFSPGIAPIIVSPLTGDKLGICVRDKDGSGIDTYLLGRNNSGAYVLVFRANGEESDGRVVFLSTADYNLFSAGFFSTSSFLSGCHDRRVYNDPPLPVPSPPG